MLNYKQWKILNESLGRHNIGLRQSQSLGLHRNRSLDEIGMQFQMPMKKKKPMPMDQEEMNPDDEDMDQDDMGGDMDQDDDMGDDDMNQDDDMGGDMGDDDMGDEDQDDDMGGDMGDDDMEDDGDEIDPDNEYEDEEDSMPSMSKKKPMMGKPHDTSAFMRRYMKEDCEDEDMEDEEISDKDGEKPAFLQKKMKAHKKKCSSGVKKCAKCAKESTNYDYYKNQINSDKDFMSSIAQQYGTPINQKFSSGLRNFKKEDILLPPIDNLNQHQNVSINEEAIKELRKKIEYLEKRLKTK